MPYNEKYFFEFDTLKTADSAVKYYRVVFSKNELNPAIYDLVELVGSNSPFVLSYKSAEDFAFYPIKTSSAEINILYKSSFSEDYPAPEEFFSETGQTEWLVQFYELTLSGTVSTLKWQGFLIDSDIQYEWQDEFYYRLTATDNLGVLREVKYSDPTEFKMPDYVPTDGVSVKDFIIELVNNTGNELNYKFAWNLYNNASSVILEDVFTSRYSALDWTKLSPYDCNKILVELLYSLGCILYLDNNDATWTILNVAEISTRTDNEVPYDMYDSDGVFISDGVIELNSSINTGATDLKWRDRNQIVTLNRPLGNVEFIHPYVMKNLLTNYSFQEDLLHTGWADNGTFSSTVGTDAYGVTGITYDKNILAINSWEDSAGSVDVSNYFFQNIDLSDTEVVAVNSSEFWGIYLEYENYDFYNILAGGDQAYNFQVTVNRTSPLNDVFYGLQTLALQEIGGQWDTFAEGRIPVYSQEGAPLQKVNLYTRYTKLYNETATIGLRYLKYRGPAVSPIGGYEIDSVRLCLTPVPYKLVTEMKFKAFTNLKYQKKEIKTLYTGGYNAFDWYCWEGALGLKDINDKLYCNALWDRHYEAHIEGTFNYLQAIVAKSILSFYRAVGRKITGNVWGEEISYPKYFEVDGAVNENTNIIIVESFISRVEADGGEAQSSACDANYLAEYNEVLSRFLMIEGTFDYAQSTTLVKIHEDLTNVDEGSFTAGFGGFTTTPSGTLPGSFGSSTQGQSPPNE